MGGSFSSADVRSIRPRGRPQHSPPRSSAAFAAAVVR